MNLTGTNIDLALRWLMAEPSTIIRDSVWRSIPLFEPALRIIDTEPFQRLRRIQQLGFASWVFPGANHTRFEHSLGTYYLTRRVLQRLLRLDECPELSRDQLDAGLAAALLHDIGHYPFSHAVEELEASDLRSHESISQELITTSPISDVLNEHWRVDPELVARLLGIAPLSGVEGLLQRLFSGTLDVDKLDYLMRDARHCNVPYGEVDVDRIVEALCVCTGDEQEPRLALHEKGAGAFQSLVFARYMMFYNVYWHHTCRICTMMFLRSVQDALADGVLAPPEIERADDADFLRLLASRSRPGSSSAVLTDRLARRVLYKRGLQYVDGDDAFSILSAFVGKSHLRRQLEIAWSECLCAGTSRRAQGFEALLDIPAAKEFFIDMPVLRRASQGKLQLTNWDRRAGLDADDLDRLQRRLRRARIVVADHDLRLLAVSRERELLEIAQQLSPASGN